MVERGRFLPVKTTNDLLLLRSDAYDLGADGALRLARGVRAARRPGPPALQTVADFEARFPAGPALAAAARSLTVRGRLDLRCRRRCPGRAELAETAAPQYVAQGTPSAIAVEEE